MKKENEMELPKRIKMKRKAMGMSMGELAKKARCSSGLISQFEGGILPKNLGKGAIARVKSILKVRVRGPNKPAAKPAKAPSVPSLLKSIEALNHTVARLALVIEAFDRHTRPASAPTGAAILTNSLDKVAVDRRYPWQAKQSAQA